MPSPFDFWSQMWTSGLGMMASGTRFTEMMVASQTVVDSRVRSMADAMRDPLNGDYKELGRMIPEKVDAFSKAGTSVWNDMGAIQSAALANWCQFTTMALSGKIPTLTDADAMWTRSSGMIYRGLKLGDKAMAPVHRRATANARRLKK